MKQLNKTKANQIELLRLIDEKLNNEYAELLSSNTFGLKIVHFNLHIAIQEGSVAGNVYFEETGRLPKDALKRSKLIN